MGQIKSGGKGKGPQRSSTLLCLLLWRSKRWETSSPCGQLNHGTLCFEFYEKVRNWKKLKSFQEWTIQVRLVPLGVSVVLLPSALSLWFPRSLCQGDRILFFFFIEMWSPLVTLWHDILLYFDFIVHFLVLVTAWLSLRDKDINTNEIIP